MLISWHLSAFVVQNVSLDDGLFLPKACHTALFRMGLAFPMGPTYVLGDTWSWTLDLAFECESNPMGFLDDDLDFNG